MKEGKDKETTAKKGGAAGKDRDNFPNLEECIMIFGGSDTICSKRQHKVHYKEPCVAETVIPSFLRWSESPITLDQRDHFSHGARQGRYLLVVDPIVRKKRLTKVLMDGGSGLNILYVDTLDAIRIPWIELRLVNSPFHGVIPGTQAYPLGQIDLTITFGDLRGGRLSWVLPHHLGAAMLRQVHGGPQLHLPEAKDARTK